MAGTTVRDIRVVQKAVESIPDIDRILKETYAAMDPVYRDRAWVRRNFSQAILRTESAAFELYKKYEDLAVVNLTSAWIKAHAQDLEGLYAQHLDNSVTTYLTEVLKRFTPVARKFEFILSQKRKSRGGLSFERLMKTQLELAGIPCEVPSGSTKKRLKRIDIVVPNQEIGLKTPDKAYFISCKRTLRERWKQSIPEREPSWRVYLATTDDSLPEDKAKEIHQLGMIAYVRDELKSQQHLSEKQWIRRLSDLPRDLRLGQKK